MRQQNLHDCSFFCFNLASSKARSAGSNDFNFSSVDCTRLCSPMGCAAGGRLRRCRSKIGDVEGGDEAQAGVAGSAGLAPVGGFVGQQRMKGGGPGFQILWWNDGPGHQGVIEGTLVTFHRTNRHDEAGAGLGFQKAA
ncbi:MAG: hypothetical protein QM757_39615 [Paludibaculum sp.]